MVLKHFVPGALALLAGTFGWQFALADVYTWTDASGRINVSNLSPPEGAHVTSIIPSPPKSEAREEAAREAARRAEIQALNDRVARLQDQVEQSRRETALPAAPVVYSPPPVPPYADWAPPAMQYVMDTPPQTTMGCDYSWGDCGAAWGAWSSWPYFANVVVVRDRNFRHRVGPGHGGRPVAPRPGVHAPWSPLRH